MTMKTTLHSRALSVALAAAAALVGCASSGVKNPSGVPVTEMKADERGFVAGTGVESQDLVAVTDKMGRSILGIQQIANAHTPPRIALDPVVNDTRFPINKEIFLTRMQTMLTSRAQGKVVFLARDRAEQQSRPRPDGDAFAGVTTAVVADEATRQSAQQRPVHRLRPEQLRPCGQRAHCDQSCYHLRFHKHHSLRRETQIFIRRTLSSLAQVGNEPALVAARGVHAASTRETNAGLPFSAFRHCGR